MAKKEFVYPNIEVLFSQDEIEERVEGLAKDIAGLGVKNLVVIPILSGSFIFAADLIRAFHKFNLVPEVDFLTLSSYGSGTTSSGSVEILRDITRDIKGRDVILVDDILDTGRTLTFAKKLLEQRSANKVYTCVLLDKPHRRVMHIKPDFSAFSCPDYFVVGYGMDISHRLRELPFIGRIMA